jgi:hypothetical protein
MLAVVLAGQAVAERIAPADAGSVAVSTVGRTGFAYLTGIRTYVAAVLWARLDPVNDTYYNSVALKDKKFLIPSIRLVTWLDPTFEEPYYDATLLILENRLPSEANDVALEGIRNNPDSGWMRANYAQVLLFEKDYRAAAAQSDLAMAGKWGDPRIEFDLLVDAEIAYNKTGQHDKAVEVVRRRAALYEQYGKNGGWSAPSSGQ